MALRLISSWRVEFFTIFWRAAIRPPSRPTDRAPVPDGARRFARGGLLWRKFPA